MINRTFFEVVSQPQTYTKKKPLVVEGQQKERCIPIENSSQIILGRNFVVDLNNPQIKKELSNKNSIVFGSSENASICIPSFFNGIHSQHAKIQRKGEKMYLSKGDETADVKIIKKKDIKPFYFGTKNLEFAQENVGDCYLLATLYSLSHIPFGETFLRDMVSIDENGNYVVKFFNRKPIVVNESELYGQQDKRSVSGELGLRAIERAYGKLINPLYMSNVNYNVASSMNISMLNKGGFMTDALYNITGLKTSVYKPSEIDLESLLTDMKQYGIEHQIITCSTPQNGKYGDFMDKNSKFISKHAYSVKDINMEDKTIEIVNPHNTKKSEIISWDDFKEMFDYICVARLKKDL